METARVDRIARAVAGARSRRAVVALLSGLALSGAAPSPITPVVAKKKRCQPCRRRRRGKCKAKKPDGASCGEGRECCDGACQSVCPLFQARNPLTCGCCELAGPVSRCSVDADCCSGNCLTIGPVDTCIPRDVGSPCDFGAQCGSGACVAGTCAAP